MNVHMLIRRSVSVGLLMITGCISTPVKSGFVCSNPEAAVKAALPQGWTLENTTWVGGGCDLALRDVARGEGNHVILRVVPPGTTPRPDEPGYPPAVVLSRFMTASNADVYLWSSAGADWPTIEQDLRAAISGPPAQVESFTLTFQDSAGRIAKVRITPHWLQLLRFRMTQAGFEKACANAVASGHVKDIRQVWINTGSHRDMWLIGMASIERAE